MPTGSNSVEWAKGMKMGQLPTGLTSGRCCDCGGAVSVDGMEARWWWIKERVGEWKW